MAAYINRPPFNVHFTIGGWGITSFIYLLKTKLKFLVPMEPVTIVHLFVDCDKVKEFWQSLQMWLLQNINIKINIHTKCIIFSYQGKIKLGNYPLAVAKPYIFSNN